MHAELIKAMVEYEAGCPQRAQHFLKVHGFAKAIAELEGVDEDTLYTLEAAAIVHDIGIKYCMENFGHAEGPLQEKEGPPIARKLLQSLGYSEGVIEHVCYLVAHHHTLEGIEGIDYQILVEADFLVNIFESGVGETAAENIRNEVFATAAGKEMLSAMFLPK